MFSINKNDSKLKIESGFGGVFCVLCENKFFVQLYLTATINCGKIL